MSDRPSTSGGADSTSGESEQSKIKPFYCPSCGTKEVTSISKITEGNVIVSGDIDKNDPSLYQSESYGNMVMRIKPVTCSKCGREFRKSDTDV